MVNAVLSFNIFDNFYQLSTALAEISGHLESPEVTKIVLIRSYNTIFISQSHIIQVPKALVS